MSIRCGIAMPKINRTLPMGPHAASDVWKIRPDLQTADSGQALSYATQTNSGYSDFSIKPDGTVVFVSGGTGGSGGGKIYQYNLTTPHDLTSGSYSNNSWNPGNVTPDSSIDTLWVRPNGASMYVATANILYQYDLTTPWDLSATINYASKSFDGYDAPTGTTGWNGIWMSDDGAVLLRAGDGTTDDQKRTVYQYALSTPWDLSTCSYASKSKLIDEGGAAGDTSLYDIALNNNGTDLYALTFEGEDEDDYVLQRWTMTTPYDVSTASYVSGGPSASANKVEGLRFFLKADDGTKLFANDHQTGGSWVTGENQIQRFSTHLIT